MTSKGLLVACVLAACAGIAAAGSGAGAQSAACELAPPAPAAICPEPEPEPNPKPKPPPSPPPQEQQPPPQEQQPPPQQQQPAQDPPPAQQQQQQQRDAPREAAPSARPALRIVSFEIPRSARARRRGMPLELSAENGRLEDVEARLIDRRGRMVARGTLAAVEGRSVLPLRLRGARMRPGVHRLKAAGYDARGETVSVERRVRFGR